MELQGDSFCLLIQIIKVSFCGPVVSRLYLSRIPSDMGAIWTVKKTHRMAPSCLKSDRQ